jgi:hypothetical protein
MKVIVRMRPVIDGRDEKSLGLADERNYKPLTEVWVASQAVQQRRKISIHELRDSAKPARKANVQAVL